MNRGSLTAERNVGNSRRRSHCCSVFTFQSMSGTKTPHFSWQRSSRVTDLTLPNDLSCTEDASLYKGLREAERQLDWTMARKVMEAQDSLSKNMPVSILKNLSCCPLLSQTPTLFLLAATYLESLCHTCSKKPTLAIPGGRDTRS